MDGANNYGKVALIRYRGGAKGEEPVDDHATGEPLAVVLGTMQLPKGVEDVVCAMEVGDERTVEVPCELGFGAYQKRLASWRPKSMVDDGYSLGVGDVVFWTNPEDGRRMPAWVTDATSDNVRLDFNHPLAGKTLEYWIELVGLE